jgi:hypothetical protein
MKDLIIDIETYKTTNQDQQAYLRSSVEPDSRLKDPEKIAADIAKKAEEVVGKTALSGDFGQIIVIGMANADRSSSAQIHTLPVSRETHACEHRFDSEAEILKEFMLKLDFISQCNNQCKIRFIGHNVKWDLRFIANRCAVHDVKLSRVFPRVNQRYDEFVYDTMTEWAGYGERISLDRLCMALGVESPKLGCDGSMVAELYETGRFDEILKYNRGDVRARLGIPIQQGAQKGSQPLRQRKRNSIPSGFRTATKK